VSVRRCRYEFRTGQRAVIYCLDVEKFQDANGVAAYYGVHAKHGSLDDFVAFMQHARSDPEFYRDWYVWSDTRPKNHRDGISFRASRRRPGRSTGAPASQADLNTWHPYVRAEIHKIMVSPLDTSSSSMPRMSNP
jgi:hypothetical protein